MRVPDVDGFGGAAADLLGGVGDLVAAADTGQQDQDFVAAGPPDGVFSADAFADPRSKCGQHHVADAVSPGVVDVLEVVDIAEQDANVGPGRPWLLQRDFEPPDGLGPVGQAGQRVEAGQSFQTLLGFDLIIGEAQRGDHAVGLAVGVDIRLRVPIDPAVSGVDGQDAESLDDRLAVSDAPQCRLQGVAIVGMDAVAETRS